jgi:hypothetical protein
MTTIDAADYLSPVDLFVHQQASWSKQARHVAERSAFYRKLWSGKAPPADLRDLPDLPVSDKGQLRLSQSAHPPFGDYLAASRDVATRLHRTSGTTGQAMNLALSARDCRIVEAVGGRCHRAAGLGPGHTVVHCLNYQMWMGGVTDHMTLEATGALVVPFGVGSTELLIRTIREIGITAISCTPSYPAVLERVLEQKFPGVAPRDLGLKLGLFGGEAGLDDVALRERIRSIWGMEPRNANYGVSDVFSNFAAQCGEDMRLHFMAADVLWPELIDAETASQRYGQRRPNHFQSQPVLAGDGDEVGLDAIRAWIGAALDADRVVVEDEVADRVDADGGRGHGANTGRDHHIPRSRRTPSAMAATASASTMVIRSAMRLSKLFMPPATPSRLLLDAPYRSFEPTQPRKINEIHDAARLCSRADIQRLAC